MSDVPAELRYTRDHEWVRDEGGGVASVGITDHAQTLLGDLVFVELPELGTKLETGAESAVVESVKAASDVYSPVTGKVVEVNEQLADSPELINQSPYGDGWIYKVRLADPDELDEMMDEAAYREFLASEAN